MTLDLATLTGDYTIDAAHTTIGFTARHAMVTNVKGKFLDFSGSLHLDGADPSRSSASIDVKMDSIDTGNADRDGHLRSADFFKTDEFPAMTFRSTGAESLGGDDYRVTGDL
ncbi:YceI family protein, partial [Streptomyces glaucescens]